MYILPLQNNYRQMHALLRERNIQSVFVQYPMRDIQRLEEMFNGVGDYEKIIFIDIVRSIWKYLDIDRIEVAEADLRNAAK